MPRIKTDSVCALSEATGTTFHTVFKLQDEVRIKPYNTEGKVVSLWLKPEGLLIEVRYYTDKERKYEYFYEEELEFVTEKKTGFRG